MTVKAYSAKYGIPESTVYKWLSGGRIPGTRSDAGWDLPDEPPPKATLGKPGSVRLRDIDGYTLSLIWLNGTVSGDAVLIRNLDAYYPTVVADRLGRPTYTDGLGRTVCKLASVGLVSDLRSVGFSGRTDRSLPPPPVDPLLFSAAFVESRSSFVYTLGYQRRHPGDKSFAYYAPSVAFCASYPILSQVVTTLSSRGLIPARKLSSAANGTSATLRITPRSRLTAIHTALSTVGRHRSFWDRYLAHIEQDRIPYYTYKSITTGTPVQSTGVQKGTNP